MSASSPYGWLVTTGVILMVAAGGWAGGPMVVAGGLAVVAAVAVAAILRPSGLPRAVAVPSPALQVSQVSSTTAPLLRFDEGMGPIFLAGLGLRLVLVVVLNSTSLWFAFGPDSNGWEIFGEVTLQQWTSPIPYAQDWVAEVSERMFYSMLNAVAIWIFGSARYPLSFLNAFVGVFVAWLFGHLASEIYGPRTGRRAALIALFFPSVVTWTCMNIREAWAYLDIILCLLAAQRLRRRIELTSLVLVALSLSGMYLIRPYLVPLLVISIAASFLLVRAKQIPYALVALVGLMAFLQIFGAQLGLSSDLFSSKQLETIHTLRTGLAYGNSAYGLDADTRTVTGSLLYLPEGIARFLFSPFPWSITSWQQALALPESLAFVYLFYQAAKRAWVDLRHNLSKVSLLLISAISITSAYGLVSGNQGTAYRHRAQVMFIIFLFTAAHQVLGSAPKNPHATIDS